MSNIIKASCNCCQTDIPLVKDRTHVPAPLGIGTAWTTITVCLSCLDAKFPNTCECCEHRYNHDRYCKIDGVCQRCQKRIKTSVYTNRLKAKKQGTDYSLTLAEWIAVLREFKYKCAYCNEPSHGIMEHFIPVVSGGATSINNCVPTCHPCNTRKRDKNPNALDFACSIPNEDINRVRMYLASK